MYIWLTENLRVFRNEARIWREINDLISLVPMAALLRTIYCTTRKYTVEFIRRVNQNSVVFKY